MSGNSLLKAALAICFAFALCLSVCAMPCVASDSEVAKNSTIENPAKGSHEERTYVNPSIKLKAYKAVLVESAVMTTTTDPNEEKVKNFLDELQGSINSSMTQALQATERFSVVTNKKDKAAAKGKYLVSRTQCQVHFGSTAARFLVGFGAGKSKLTMIVSLVDPETGEVVLKYTGWGGAIAGFGAQVMDKMRVDTMSISNYFGGLVRKQPE
ncbi:MAG TPA: DUF4410 domain-containing protein [Dissulfurispiraceae bacterium]|nr:DUF4410 domain-containing protein [Dissulfurispiraceae bacterium]